MTAIAGLVDNDGRVWIGGDSAGSSGYSATVRADVKVFRNGPYLFGFTTSFRMGQLLHHALTPPVPPSNPARHYEFLVTEFVDALRSCLSDGGYAQKLHEVESGGTFLVGFGGALYCIEDDYQVGIPALGYEAVGCGSDLVLGSLHATRGLKWSPRRRITTALEAASTFNGAVLPPFVIKSVAP